MLLQGACSHEKEAVSTRKRTNSASNNIYIQMENVVQKLNVNIGTIRRHYMLAVCTREMQCQKCLLWTIESWMNFMFVLKAYSAPVNEDTHKNSV